MKGPWRWSRKMLTRVMLNKLRFLTLFYLSANQITWSRLLIQIHMLNDKQCRSRSLGFWRSQLIWICTVSKSGAYQGPAGWGQFKAFQFIQNESLWRLPLWKALWCNKILILITRYQLFEVETVQYEIKYLYILFTNVWVIFCCTTKIHFVDWFDFSMVIFLSQK